MATRTHKRCLIVNADDFGRSPAVNRGIIKAHQHGIVTSASLMVRWPAAREAAVHGREHPKLSLGLHFDFSEWTCRQGTWVRVYQVVPEDDTKAVTCEASRQLATFRRLVDQDPTHIDSHQHAHRNARVNSILVEIAGRLGVPLRGCNAPVRYCGNFYGQTSDGWPLPSCISVNALIKILMKLRPGFTELGCHPGEADDLDSMYQEERAKEVKTLCDPRVRAAIANFGIELCSFHDFVARWNDVWPREMRDSGPFL